MVSILLLSIAMPMFPKPRFALYVALSCAIAQAASAMELGESHEQLVAKHGAPAAEDHARNLAMYYWEGWSAQLQFQQNVIAKLIYRRTWYLSEAEIHSLLQSNGGASRWHEVAATNGKNRQWSRDDGAIAVCLREKPLTMVFQSAGFAEPKIVIPGTPPPEFSKSTFPQLFGQDVEPELPVADPPTTLQTKAGPLPKLPAKELSTESSPTQATPDAAQPKAESTSRVQTPSAQSPNPSAPGEVSAPSHALSYILGAIVLSAMAGGGAYWYRCRLPLRPASRSLATRVENNVAETSGPSSGLEKMRPDQFELLIAEVFRRQGYTPELSAAMGADGSIDLILRRDADTILVQCAYSKLERVTEAELREFYAAMVTSGAPRGIIVTMGTFTPGARTYAQGKSLELIDGNAVLDTLATVTKLNENILRVAGWIDEFISHARVFDPECPVCHGTMHVRHSRANGAPLWCCRSYPRCPGRREPRVDLLPATTH
jgi:restriction system protein